MIIELFKGAAVIATIVGAIYTVMSYYKPNEASQFSGPKADSLLPESSINTHKSMNKTNEYLPAPEKIERIKSTLEINTEVTGKTIFPTKGIYTPQNNLVKKNESARILIGEWEAQVPNNRFHIKIVWNERKEEFHGFLSAQGKLSEHVGFKLGEFIYAVKYSSDTDQLKERFKLKVGAGGQSSREEWVKGDIYISSWPSDGEILIYGGRRLIRMN